MPPGPNGSGGFLFDFHPRPADNLLMPVIRSIPAVLLLVAIGLATAAIPAHTVANDGGTVTPPAASSPASQSQPDATQPARYPALVAVLKSARGEVRIDLGVNEAPRMVAWFVTLAEKGVYQQFHVDGGYRNEKIEFGTVGKDAIEPGLVIPPKFSPKYRFQGPGDVSLFPLRENEVGATFFITYAQYHNRELSWPLIGRVSSGMDVVNQLIIGDAVDIEIEGDSTLLKADFARAIAQWSKKIDPYMALRQGR